MKDVIKSIAEANGWEFVYGRSDFHNLYDGLDNGAIVLFLDPLQSSDQLGERGNTEAVNWSGSFLLCMDSDIDEGGYEDRYDKYIGPITGGAEKIFKNAIKCMPDYTITSWRATEIINSMDFNADGRSITFIIEQLINE